MSRFLKIIFFICVIGITFCFGTQKPDGLVFPRSIELSGRVEILRAKTTEWRMLGKGRLVKHNDKIFVHPKASVLLQYPDGTKVYINSNSKILFHNSRISGRRNAMKFITVYYGQIFFLSKKHWETEESRFNRVHGPLTSILAHNAVFAFSHLKDSSVSDISVLSGRLEVALSNSKHIEYLRDGMAILADKKEYALSNVNPKEFLFRHPWIDSALVERAYLQGKLTRKRVNDYISGRRPGKVLITPFSMSGKYFGHWDVKSFLTRFTAEKFSEVTYREVSVEGDRHSNPFEIGKRLSADRVISGDIKKFEFGKVALLSADSTKYELHIAVKYKVLLKLYLPDEGAMVREKWLEGELISEEKADYHLDTLFQQPLDYNNYLIRESVLGVALEELGEDLRKFGKKVL